MGNRYMRLILMFDLPTETNKDKRNYRLFRKYLIESGFVMMQKSIYTKIVENPTKARTQINNLELNAPSDGLVQIMVITEKQYNNMILLIGTVESEVINDRRNVVVL